eukprot:TRINITY_DN4663_c1_g1_i1.p1 TRINITY_DN4663_c1_g1~~TRINITY_DN4663_c1_g1_i1.p1  ORF type:complete len:605 (+),score=185.43 TRINITY_DN4663_c1_g1_i1:186-2000(+)
MDSARSDADRPHSGSRAHELLATLDAAKRQKVQNEKLRHLVLDAEDLTRKLHSQVCSAKSRAEIDRAHQRSFELLRELDEGVSFTHLTKFNVSRYMTDCAQEMQVRDLFRSEDKPDVAPVDGLVAALQDLRGRGNHSAHFLPTIDQALHTLGKVQVLMHGSQLQGSEWAATAQPLLLLLRDVVHHPAVPACLTELNEQVNRLKFSVQEVSQEQASAVERGDMQESEQLYYKKITIQEALADTITKKFDAIDAEEDSLFRNPLRRVHEVHTAANRTVSDLLQQKESLKKRCEKDLANLNSRVEHVNMLDYNETKAHSTALDKLSWAMKENQLQQDACWQKMAQLEKDLVSLGEQRHAHIQDHIRLVEEGEKRKVEYQHFMEFISQHKGLLELSVHNCDLAEEITDCIDEVISAGCNSVERRMREVESELEGLRVSVHEEYLEQFRHMYLTLGDLQYKKEATISAIEEKIQSAHMQQEMMMESLNPKAKEYSKLKKDLARTKEELEAQVGTLREKSTLYIEAFKPTEQALMHAGKDFVHPVRQLEDMNEQRHSKLRAYHQLLADESNTEAALDAERDQIDHLRLTAHTHKSGSPQAVSPARAIEHP